jgi:hypothetical protein
VLILYAIKEPVFSVHLTALPLLRLDTIGPNKSMHDSNELEGIWKETAAVEYMALFLYQDRKKGQKLGKTKFQSVP